MKQIAAITNYGASTVKSVICKVASAIIENMEDIFLTTQTCEYEWLEVAADFESRTCMPNCIGSIGKLHTLYIIINYTE